jgi:hypothetical protein
MSIAPARGPCPNLFIGCSKKVTSGTKKSDCDMSTAYAPRHAVRRSALKHMIETFFDGSAEKLVSMPPGSEGSKVMQDELDCIAQISSKARKGKR